MEEWNKLKIMYQNKPALLHHQLVAVWAEGDKLNEFYQGLQNRLDTDEQLYVITATKQGECIVAKQQIKEIREIEKDKTHTTGWQMDNIRRVLGE